MSTIGKVGDSVYNFLVRQPAAYWLGKKESEVTPKDAAKVYVGAAFWWTGLSCVPTANALGPEVKDAGTDGQMTDAPRDGGTGDASEAGLPDAQSDIQLTDAAKDVIVPDVLPDRNLTDVFPTDTQVDKLQTDAIPDSVIPDAIQDARLDGPVCVPHTYFDNTFSNGINPINVVVKPGSISLAEDYNSWTSKYEGDVLPTAAGWVDYDPLAWTAPTPEIQSGTILHLNTIDSDRYGYFSKNQSFSNATGWIVETRMKVGDNTQSNPSANGCAIEVDDGVKTFALRFLNTRILDFTSGLEYVMDTRADFHAYRIVGKSDNVFVYVDGVLRLNGVNALTSLSSVNTLKFHDLTTTADSEAFWDYVYLYNGGTALRFSASGSVIFGMIDTGSTVNNIGSGATIKWAENLPAGTSVAIEIFASNNPSLPGASCASGLSNSSGETIPSSCAGRYVWWKPNLYASTPPDKTPVINDITINYETCN